MDTNQIFRSIYNYYDEQDPNFSVISIAGIHSFTVKPKRGLNYILGEMRLGMATIFLVNIAIFKLLNLHFSHFLEKSYLSTFLFLWVFSLNCLGFIPKIINYRNFHKAKKINDKEQLKKRLLEIFGKRIYKLSFDFAGMSIISHFVAFIFSVKYFFLKRHHEYDVDLFLFIYSIIYHMRIVYSFMRYKKYFCEEGEFNPYGLEIFEYGKERKGQKFGVKEKEDCSICWTGYKDGDFIAVFPCPGKHAFHLKCINNWLKRSYTCPICRKILF